MRVARLVLCIAVAVLLAGPAASEVGTFSSFSTTATPVANGFTFDSVLTTTGATSPTSSDSVIMFIVLGPVHQDVTTCSPDALYVTSTGSPVYRGLGGNTFHGQFSFSGLTDSAYKWGAIVAYFGGSPTFGPSTLYSNIYSFLYNTWCPFLTNGVNSGSTMFTLSNPPGYGPGVFRLGVELGRQELVVPIPTLGTWALLALGVLLAAAGFVILRRA